MTNPIQISGEIDFEKLLKRLSDDIVTAPAFLRIGKRLGECFQEYRDEVSQAEFFWAMVSAAVLETGWSRLARIYDQERRALSLRTLLVTIEANKHLFDDNSVVKRVNPSFAQSIVPGSHMPDSKILLADLARVSSGDPLVNKLVKWRHNFGAHISPSQTIHMSFPVGSLPTPDEALALCDRAFDVFNHYTFLFQGGTHLKMIIGEAGSLECVFKHLRTGLAAGRKAQMQATEQLLAAMKSAQ